MLNNQVSQYFYDMEFSRIPYIIMFKSNYMKRKGTVMLYSVGFMKWA